MQEFIKKLRELGATEIKIQFIGERETALFSFRLHDKETDMITAGAFDTDDFTDENLVNELEAAMKQCEGEDA